MSIWHTAYNQNTTVLLLRHVLPHGPTLPSSGRLSLLMSIPPTHLFAIGNHHALLKPMPVRALLSLTSIPACRTTRMLPTLPARPPACCQAIACLTTKYVTVLVLAFIYFLVMYSLHWILHLMLDCRPFLHLLCKVHWVAIVYEMCYINKAALPCQL